MLCGNLTLPVQEQAARKMGTDIVFSAISLTASAITVSKALLEGPGTECMFSCNCTGVCSGFFVESIAKRKLEMSSEILG